jgi:2-polyprenyl-3-methyl-5-hydroxy-6-metoxy-1,4-benzoquinol methylase
MKAPIDGETAQHERGSHVELGHPTASQRASGATASLTMQNWHESFQDPNDPRLLDSRRAEIVAARQAHLVSDRVAYLSELARGKNILDVGVVEHFVAAHENPNWLHRHLARSAASCLGVDLLETETRKLAEAGFNVAVADLTKEPLNQQFDLIVAGEVLEHVDAPGKFMKNCAAMLRPDGRLVITVPNPWYVNAVLKSALRSHAFVDSADHVCWYDASTLVELGQRNGLHLLKFVGIAVRQPSKAGAKLFFALSPLMIFCGVSPFLFAKSIIYEFGLLHSR